MQLGIFAKTFVRPSLDATLDAVRHYGLDCVQFNFSCVGMPTLPERIEPDAARQIAAALAARQLTMAAVSGTCNLIHPDVAQRRASWRRLETLTAACPDLGTTIVTLCTGTRHPHDMWRRHPDNDRADAWADLVASVRFVLHATEGTGVTLAFEPEVANVVDTTAKARRLLDEIASPQLKVVLDPANLFHVGQLPHMTQILNEAFELLARDVVLAHAKDLNAGGQAGDKAAGQGVLDYDLYLRLLADHCPEVPLVLHGLAEGEVDDSVAFLHRNLLRLAAGRAAESHTGDG